jgi:hypothetical protein
MQRPVGELTAAYTGEAARHEGLRDRERSRARLVSYARVASFLGGAACVAGAWTRNVEALAWGSAAAALFLAFFVLVYRHSQIDARERWHDALAQVFHEAAARVARAWGRLAPIPVAAPVADHPYAEDLDLFGRASVLQLLGWTGSEPGRRTLRAWLLAPASPAVVAGRQAAVRELAPLETFRADLAGLGRLVEPGGEHLDAFFDWAASPGWMRAARWLVPATGVLRVATLVLIAAHAAGLVEGAWWAYPMVAGLGLWAACARRIHVTFTRVFSRQPLFQQYAEMFRRIAALPAQAPALVALQSRLSQSGLTAAREMDALDRLKRLGDLRYQALFHFPVNALTLWDFGVTQSLEGWQRRVGPHLREWFDVLGEIDALAALASLAHDNPDWCFPEIRPDADRLSARGLGHPLLPGEARVGNDVEVGPPGTLLLVTGSNMSGKSTLLRSIGVNVVLAQAGAPVCAEAFSMPPLETCTSMRVQDSLEAGVSYFMAALRRLKLVVDAARAAPAGKPPRLLYLLDEVLQGTNTAERQVAVRRVLQHLLSLPVIGAVTTHDLELAESAPLHDACRAVHFTEGVEAAGDEVRLSFDYRLRPGVATSRNALKLLHLVGLDVSR